MISWPDGERYLRPPRSLVVSLASTLDFSRTGGALSHLNSSTRRFPPRNLCSLVMLAVFSLVYAATDTVLISLGLAESRILPAAPANTLPRTPLISFCIFQLWTLCAVYSLSLRPLVQTLGSFPASGFPWSSDMPPSLGRGRVINKNLVLKALISEKMSILSGEKWPIYSCSSIDCITLTFTQCSGPRKI